MWPNLIVASSPPLDQHARFLQGKEDFPREQLIPQLAVERLVIAVLQGLPGSMYSVFTPTREQPALRGKQDEKRASIWMRMSPDT